MATEKHDVLHVEYREITLTRDDRTSPDLDHTVDLGPLPKNNASRSVTVMDVTPGTDHVIRFVATYVTQEDVEVEA